MEKRVVFRSAWLPYALIAQPATQERIAQAVATGADNCGH